MDISNVNLIQDQARWNGAEISIANNGVDGGKPVPARTEQAAADFAPAGPKDKEALDRAIAEINRTMEQNGTKLQFSINDKTHHIMVQVLDAKTGEVIREVPPKKIVESFAMIREQSGLLIDESA